MSFGYSASDALQLVQLAWKTVQNSRKACGEHDELTREVLSLHVVLQRLELEMRKADSPINRPKDTCREELQVIVGGCQRVLNVLDKLLEKYNALGAQEKSGRKLWQRIRFGNGEMADLGDLRGKAIYYTSAMNLFLNMATMDSMGRVEKHMDEAGGDLKDIKQAVNGITAHLMSKSNHEGSVLTAYGDDDRAVWKEFRRELLKDGFSSSILRKHKATIKAYVTELGGRGLLDEDLGSVDNTDEVTRETHEAVSVEGPRLPGETERNWYGPKGLRPDQERTNVGDHGLLSSKRTGQEYIEARMSTGAKYFVDSGGGITMAGPSSAKTSHDNVALTSCDLPNTSASSGPSTSRSGEGSEDHELNSDDTQETQTSEDLSLGLNEMNVQDGCGLLHSERVPHEPTLSEKFDDIDRTYRSRIVPQCKAFICGVTNQMRVAILPSKKRVDRKCKLLSAIVLNDVLIKLDSLDVGSDDGFRLSRKSLVNEAHAILTALDETLALISALIRFDEIWRVFRNRNPFIIVGRKDTLYNERLEATNLRICEIIGVDWDGNPRLKNRGEQFKADIETIHTCLAFIQEEERKLIDEGIAASVPLPEGDDMTLESKEIFSLFSPTYFEVHKNYIDPETLNEFKLPWEWFERNAGSIVVKRWMPVSDLEVLFEHTRKLRKRRAHGISATT